MRSLELCLLHPLPDSPQRARFPALQRLLSRGRHRPVQAGTVEAFLLSRFNVSRQRDWPVAPIARVGDGEQPDPACWMCADPIHLQVDRDALVLVDASRFDLGEGEAEPLVRSLNEHFSPAGIRFTAPTAKRWYARLERIPDIEAVPLREAAGRNIDPLLPRGADALTWHRAFNEAQMLLHTHPVNEAREARGAPAINSVWFWGAGTLPERVWGNFVHVWADDALSLGLARLAGVPSAATPADFAGWAVQAVDGDHLVVCEQDDVEELEARWLTPVLQALRQRSLTELRLTAPLASAVERFDVARADLWKFWRSAPA